MSASRVAEMSPADASAHAAASNVRPTLSRVAIRTEICRSTIADLSARSSLSPAQFDLLASAQTELAELGAVAS
ncbi:hypothetical protein ACFU76_04655 [Streptomyces sp. NPDC057539]|uniref:hypothetical protein n=1 Tax=Streptomyces sp. NPDC057539 TaxID=3346159 RepID=UPI0036ACD598